MEDDFDVADMGAPEKTSFGVTAVPFPGQEELPELKGEDDELLTPKRFSEHYGQKDKYNKLMVKLAQVKSNYDELLKNVLPVFSPENPRKGKSMNVNDKRAVIALFKNAEENSCLLISLHLILAHYDNNSKEYPSIVEAIADQYKFKRDLLSNPLMKQLFEYAKMEFGVIAF